MSVIHVHGSHLSLRKMGGIATAAAVICVAAIGGWLQLHSRARAVPPTGAVVDPSQILIDGKGLPAQQMIDFSVIFE